MTASNVVCTGRVTSAEIGLRQVGQDQLERIAGIAVECNGECGDGTLGDICGPSRRPIAVSCSAPVDFFGGSCPISVWLAHLLVNLACLPGKFFEVDTFAADFGSPASVHQ